MTKGSATTGGTVRAPAGRRPFLGLLTALLLLGAPGTATAAPAVARNSAGDAEFARTDIGQIFAQSRRGGEIDLVVLEVELGRVQPVPVQVLFAILDRREVAIPQLDGPPLSHRLSEEERDVVTRVLTAAPLPALRRHLELVVDHREPRPTCELGIRILGDAGDPRDFGLLARLAISHVEVGAVPRSTRRAFGAALEAILLRHRGGLWSLQDLYGGVALALRDPIVHAIETAPHEDSLQVLVRLLGGDPGMDAIVLAAVSRRAERTPQPVDEGLRSEVRRFLHARDEAVVLLATTAVGKLEDYAAVPPLMAELEEAKPNHRRHLFAALRDITRTNLRSDLDLWTRWYEAEMLWWDSESERAFQILRHGKSHLVSRTINQISQLKLHRHELAEALVPCLDHEEPAVAVLACDALAALGSHVVVHDLIACLDGGEQRGVGAAAWKALRTITGRDLPPDSASWEMALE